MDHDVSLLSLATGDTPKVSSCPDRGDENNGNECWHFLQVDTVRRPWRFFSTASSLSRTLETVDMDDGGTEGDNSAFTIFDDPGRGWWRWIRWGILHRLMTTSAHLRTLEQLQWLETSVQRALPVLRATNRRVTERWASLLLAKAVRAYVPPFQLTLHFYTLTPMLAPLLLAGLLATRPTRVRMNKANESKRDSSNKE